MRETLIHRLVVRARTVVTLGVIREKAFRLAILSGLKSPTCLTRGFDVTPFNRVFLGAHSRHIKLGLPQAPPLSIFWKIWCVALALRQLAHWQLAHWQLIPWQLVPDNSAPIYVIRQLVPKTTRSLTTRTITIGTFNDPTSFPGNGTYLLFGLGWSIFT